MNEEILNTILINTYTLPQLKHRLNILKSYLLATFFGNPQPGTILPEDLNWLNSLPKQFYQQFTKDNVYEIFDALQEASLKLSPLTIYVAFDPDQTTINQIGDYTRKLFGNHLVIDTKFDFSLIAGASLSYKGILRDYSLRAKIEEKKQEILAGFKSFLR